MADVHSMLCVDIRHGQRRGIVTIHGLKKDELRGGVFSRRTICDRKVRLILAFDGTYKPLKCPDCLVLFPELKVPEPGAVLARALSGPPADKDTVELVIGQALAASAARHALPNPEEEDYPVIDDVLIHLRATDWLALAMIAVVCGYVACVFDKPLRMLTSTIRAIRWRYRK